NINPHWDDERLYQEARRIVIAQIQHITYNEFLPLIVGKDSLRQFGLSLQTYAYDSDYDLKIDSTVLNEFASVVGLFFFSLFPERLTLYGENGEKVLQKPLGAFFYDPSILQGKGHIDSLLRFLLNESIRKPGLHMNKQFRDEFLHGAGSYSLDLAAMVIQMGRDHGIPGYTAIRSSCGLRRPSNFSDLDDITRRGDRFWYENFFVPSAFTIEQLNEIRRTSLARVICDNADGIRKIQQNVFALADNFGCSLLSA
ncbi:unnamed protein product, partial [Toxocara canis]|uniref:Nucleotidyltransferase n=1 Tax=Toxocara canis TaxID=6265 RepID=A0A183U1B5_TOXCA